MKIPASKDTGTEAYNKLYAVLGRIYGGSHLLSLERNAYTSRKEAACQGKSRDFSEVFACLPAPEPIDTFPGMKYI